MRLSSLPLLYASPPSRGGSRDLYRSARRPLLVDARTTIALCHEQGVVCIPFSASPHAPGSTIADVPSNIRGANAGIFEANQGRELRGQMILEVPEQKAKISPKVLEYANDHNIKIRDIKGKFYN